MSPMALKPWYKVVTPREDLRDGRPLDASEFAVHLDHVRDHRAPADYQEPARFFDRTFLTTNLTELAVSTVRRLSGIKVETSAVFNLTTSSYYNYWSFPFKITGTECGCTMFS